MSSGRVFSFRNWEIFWGFNPSHTAKYRKKLKKADGYPVKFTGVTDFFTGDKIYSFTYNPFGNWKFDIPEIITRPSNGSDYIFDEVIRNDELSARIIFEMNKDRSCIPSGFSTIAYIDDFDTNQGGFAIVSVSSKSIGDIADFYKLHSQIWPISNRCRTQMIKEELVKNFRFIPNGVLDCNNDICVFVLPIEQIIDCMKSVNLGFKYEFSRIEIDRINRYLECYDDVRTLNRSLESWYKGLCIELLDRFSDTLEECVPYYPTTKHDNDAPTLKQIANRVINKTVSKNQIKNNLSKRFKSIISEEAFSYLVDAEYLYQSHKHDNIDFGPIIVQFAKAFECEIKNRASEINAQAAKYENRLKKLLDIVLEGGSKKNQDSAQVYNDIIYLRNEGAHSGIKNTLTAVEEIRDMYYNHNLFENL